MDQKPLSNEPWERQLDLGEGSRAFSAFRVYRNLGPGRSLAKAAETLVGGKSRAKVGQLEKWSAAYRWVERAAAWDDEQDRQLRIARNNALKAMEERHAALAVQLQAKVLERLRGIDVEKLTPANVAKWLDISVKIERQARGEPGEIVDHKVEGGLQIAVTEVVISDRKDAKAVLSGLAGPDAVP